MREVLLLVVPNEVVCAAPGGSSRNPVPDRERVKERRGGGGGGEGLLGRGKTTHAKHPGCTVPWSEQVPVADMAAGESPSLSINCAN